MDKGIISNAVQVCFDLTGENLQREISGLFEAMKKFQLQGGTIVTLAQNDQFVQDGMSIKVIPFHDFARR